jgi:prepilin peptidase CpaA
MRRVTLSSVAASAGVALFPLAMVYAGIMDLMTLKIRNSLVLGLAVAWLALAPAAGFDLASLGASVAVAVLVFVLAFAFFALGWIGGGDAKLAAVTALWFAPAEALLYYTYAAFIGGLLTLAILQLRARMIPMPLYRVAWIAQLHDANTGVPYGAAMAPAALIVFPGTAWLDFAFS